MKLTVAEIVEWSDAELLSGDASLVVESFANDSRSAQPGACFVAIVADRDGHDFVDDAFQAGATAAIVARRPASLRHAHDRVLIRHPDPVAALGLVARAVRSRELRGASVVGITGSTGKTSTKDLLRGALGSTLSVHANAASFNNEIGLPLTVLSATSETDVLVLEMGARFAGNIRDLCAIASPTVGLITNIGRAHGEHLGTVEQVVAVKAELLDALPPDGVAVLPIDDPQFAVLAAHAHVPVISAGRDRAATVRVVDVALDGELRPRVALASPWGAVNACLAMRGEHQAANAALAAAVALHLGVPPSAVAAGLEQAVGSPWRMHLEANDRGVTILNDAYNANPASMSAALDALGALDVVGSRIAVLGAMRELGSDSRRLHELVGAHLSGVGVDALIAVGEEGRWIAAGASDLDIEFVADADAALVAARRRATAGDAVLIKASRAIHLETVAAGLLVRVTA